MHERVAEVGGQPPDLAEPEFGEDFAPDGEDRQQIAAVFLGDGRGESRDRDGPRLDLLELFEEITAGLRRGHPNGKLDVVIRHLLAEQDFAEPAVRLGAGVLRVVFDVGEAAGCAPGPDRQASHGVGDRARSGLLAIIPCHRPPSLRPTP